MCCAGIYPQVYNSIYTLVHLLGVGEAAPYPYSVIGQRCALQFGGVEVIIPLQIKQETPSTLRRPTPPPTSAVLTTDNDNGWIIILHHIIRTYSMYSAAISMPLTEGQQHFNSHSPRSSGIMHLVCSCPCLSDHTFLCLCVFIERSTDSLQTADRRTGARW